MADSKDAPPSYAVNAPEVTPPDITAAFSNLNLKETTDVPTVDQCLAHLKLLEALNQLREEIGNTDGLFGLKDEVVPKDVSKKEQESILLKLHEKRWACYVTQASLRFEQWWKTTIQRKMAMLQRKDMDSPSFPGSANRGNRLRFDRSDLPPLGQCIPMIYECLC